MNPDKHKLRKLRLKGVMSPREAADALGVDFNMVFDACIEILPNIILNDNIEFMTSHNLEVLEKHFMNQPQNAQIDDIKPDIPETISYSISDIAKILNKSNSAITRFCKKVLPGIMNNGKTTYLNEEEFNIVIKHYENKKLRELNSTPAVNTKVTKIAPVIDTKVANVVLSDQDITEKAISILNNSKTNIKYGTDEIIRLKLENKQLRYKADKYDKIIELTK